MPIFSKWGEQMKLGIAARLNECGMPGLAISRVEEEIVLRVEPQHGNFGGRTKASVHVLQAITLARDARMLQRIAAGTARKIDGGDQTRRILGCACRCPITAH